MAGKREFLRDHDFSLMDYVVWHGTMVVIALPMFYALLWLMDLAVGVAVPADAALMLIFLTFLFSACAGMSAGLSLVRFRARKRSPRS